MKRLLPLLLVFVMVFSLTACKNDESDSPLYQVPDFTDPPKAIGSTVVTTLDEMIELANNVPTFSFAFSDELDKCKQTFYTKEDKSDAEEMEESLSLLGGIKYHLQLMNVRALAPFDASKFSLGDDNKMAYMTLENNSLAFNENVVTDIAFDLTDKSIVVRGMYVMSDEESNTDGTYYESITLKFLGDNKYQTTLWYGEYVEKSSVNYSIIATEQFTFTWQDDTVVEGDYSCTQQTAIAESAVNEGANGMLYLEDQFSAEAADTTASITMRNGKYIITRSMVLKATDKSMNVNDAKEIYRVTQELRAQDDGYLLTEIATGETEDGGTDSTKQYVLFEPKT